MAAGSAHRSISLGCRVAAAWGRASPGHVFQQPIARFSAMPKGWVRGRISHAGNDEICSRSLGTRVDPTQQRIVHGARQTRKLRSVYGERRVLGLRRIGWTTIACHIRLRSERAQNAVIGARRAAGAAIVGHGLCLYSRRPEAHEQCRDKIHRRARSDHAHGLAAISEASVAQAPDPDAAKMIGGFPRRLTTIHRSAESAPLRCPASTGSAPAVLGLRFVRFQP